MNNAASITITAAEITWSENNSIAELVGRKFSTLAELDDAVIYATWHDEPPVGGCYNKTGYRLTFSDGDTYEGRCDLTGEMVDQADAIGAWFVEFQTAVANTSPKHPFVSEENRKAAREYLAIVERSAAAASTDRDTEQGDAMAHFLGL